MAHYRSDPIAKTIVIETDYFLSQYKERINFAQVVLKLSEWSREVLNPAENMRTFTAPTSADGFVVGTDRSDVGG